METAEITIQSSMSTASSEIISISVLCKRTLMLLSWVLNLLLVAGQLFVCKITLGRHRCSNKSNVKFKLS